jgi:multicomponent Na+:H+ antiporter subunit B
MIELYLRLLDRVLTPLLLLIGVVLLLRGHDAPGGGFIAALMVSAAIALQILSNGARLVRARIGRALQPLIATGLLLGVGSALLGVFTGQGFFAGIWWSIHWGPIDYKIGTPVLFDLGVFLAVTGATIAFMLGLSTNVIETTDEPRLGKRPVQHAAQPARRVEEAQ